MILEMIYNVDGTNVHRNWTGFGFVSRMQGQTSRHPSMLLADTYECIDGKRIDESPLYDVHHPQRTGTLVSRLLYGCMEIQLLVIMVL